MNKGIHIARRAGRPGGLKTVSYKIVYVEIVSVEAAVKQHAWNAFRHETTRVVVPDAPQLESELADTSQRSPVADQLLRRPWAVNSTRVKLDQELFDLRQALWTGQNGVECAPFRTLDVDFQYVDCSLRNTALRVGIKYRLWLDIFWL